jgi:hypothetical protein
MGLAASNDLRDVAWAKMLFLSATRSPSKSTFTLLSKGLSKVAATASSPECAGCGANATRSNARTVLKNVESGYIQDKAPRVGGLNFFVLYVLRRDIVQVSFQFQLKLQRRPRARVSPMGCALHALPTKAPLLMCLRRSRPERTRSLVS